jgi:hypothetical protein
MHCSTRLLSVHQPCYHVSDIIITSSAHKTNSQYRTPETFDIVSKTVDIAGRKNLAQISRMLTQITSGREFDDNNPCYVPVNEYVRKAIGELTTWLIEGMYHVPILTATIH